MVNTYVINLKESVDRKSFMEAQLRFFPELEFEFLEAIDARDFSVEDINHVYDEELAKKILNRPMVKGEIGVVLSQLEAMKRISSNRDYGLIMEDDLLISAYLSESLTKAIDYIQDPYPRIVLFTAIPQYTIIDPIEINKLQNRHLFKVWKDASCAACYLINKPACDLIINEYPKIYNVIDNWGYFIQQNKIEIRAVVPHLVSFSKLGFSSSTININDIRDSAIRKVINKVSLYQRLKRKIWNNIEKYKYKVITNKNYVWDNDLGIIQSIF